MAVKLDRPAAAVKVGRPPIGPAVTVALPPEQHRLLARLARRRRLRIEAHGVQTRMMRHVMQAGFEALRARGEL